MNYFIFQIKKINENFVRTNKEIFYIVKINIINIIKILIFNHIKNYFSKKKIFPHYLSL
jgi:hypothetical protein